MALDNLLEQVSQISGDISNVPTVDGDISNVAHIDGDIGNVIPVDISANYEGVIMPEDWVLRDDGYYYYKVVHTTHRLLNPFVNKYLVETSDGFDNAFFSYTVLANRDVRFRSHLAVKCEYNITGKR